MKATVAVVVTMAVITVIVAIAFGETMATVITAMAEIAVINAGSQVAPSTMCELGVL